MDELQFIEQEERPSMGLGALLARYEAPIVEQKKKGGINGVLTEQRVRASEILGLPLLRVARMTKGWRGDQLYDLNQKVSTFVNPPALWWKLYKKIQNERKRHHQELPISERKEGRKKDSGKRQGVLFENR